MSCSDGCEIRLGHVPVARCRLGQYQRIVECCTSLAAPAARCVVDFSAQRWFLSAIGRRRVQKNRCEPCHTAAQCRTYGEPTVCSAQMQCALAICWSWSHIVACAPLFSERKRQWQQQYGSVINDVAVRLRRRAAPYRCARTRQRAACVRSNEAMVSPLRPTYLCDTSGHTYRQAAIHLGRRRPITGARRHRTTRARRARQQQRTRRLHAPAIGAGQVG